MPETVFLLLILHDSSFVVVEAVEVVDEASDLFLGGGDLALEKGLVLLWLRPLKVLALKCAVRFLQLFPASAPESFLLHLP